MTPLKYRLILGLVLCVIVTGNDTHAETGSRIDYGKQIQPILAEHCYACHGPDEQTRQAELRLDLREVAISELDSGNRAVVPGEAGDSEMVRRILSDDPDQQMPPPDFRKQLTDDSKRLLKQWILQGADYDQHWSFRPILKPEPPQIGSSWGHNEIDRFVLSRLRANDLTPSAEAEHHTLIRRLSLDLRGLPPTLAELQRFADADYDAIVDAMLSSAHYGERMAQDWLDLARYGDTNGYHNDSERSMWLYRDYVINSFNDNKPYDRFIIENMAGDLLPDANQETRVASGFNRCVTFNEEGGADPDEFYVTYAVDRANTTGQVFLGLTVGCAQCHDHKYDPISQKEYYQLFAFFNSVDGEIGAGGQSGYHNKPLPPLLKVLTPEMDRQIAEVETQIVAAEKRLAKLCARPEYADPTGLLRESSEAWAKSLQANTIDDLRVQVGLKLWLDAETLPEQSQRIATWPDRSENGFDAVATGKPHLLPDAINGNAVVRLDGEHDFLRTANGGEHLKADFTMVMVSRFHKLEGHQMALMWGDESGGKRRALWKHSGGHKLSFNGYSADVTGSQAYEKDIPAIAIITKSGKDDLIRLSMNGKAGGEGKPGLGDFTNTAITIGANNAGNERSAIDLAEILVYDRALDDVELASVGDYLARRYDVVSDFMPAPNEIRQIAQRSPATWQTEQRRQLFDYFIANVHPGSADASRLVKSEIEQLRNRRDRIEQAKPSTMVMVEMAKRKPAFVLMRGNFQQPADEVGPDVPAIFPRLSKGQPRNRLGLAHWLTDPNHPLVARVVVNRIWKQLFGAGLVKTMGDFGTQGDRPSHPELLDWLAADFVQHHWDIKRLQRLIVQSATYRQSSRYASTKANEIDPENRLLSRATRFRLSAEEVRDVALSVSGLMNPKVGGPSVKPHQPAGYLSSIGKNWEVSSGEALYRRGLYTFWRRTMLYPSFQIFDAPSREFCTVDRPRTNTPLQALVTLNDPVFVEAAQELGRQLHSPHANSQESDSGGADRKRLAHAFQRVTSRQPLDEELALLQSILDEQRNEYRAKPDSAKQFAKGGSSASAVELAAWMALSNVLLNLDEAITRE